MGLCPLPTWALTEDQNSMAYSVKHDRKGSSVLNRAWPSVGLGQPVSDLPAAGSLSMGQDKMSPFGANIVMHGQVKHGWTGVTTCPLMNNGEGQT